MWKYIKQYKYHNLGIVLLLLTYSLIGTGQAFLQMYLGGLVFEGAFRKVVLFMGINALVHFGNQGILYGEKRLAVRTIAGMNREMRRDISRKLTGRSFREFEEQDSGEYISWYTNDVKEAENQGFQNLYQCINWILQLVSGATALIIIRVELLICTIAVSILMMYLSDRMGRKVERASENVSNAMEVFTNASKEQISGFTMLKSFGKLDRFETGMNAAGTRMEGVRYAFVRDREKTNIRLGVCNVLCINLLNIMTFMMCLSGAIPMETIFGSINLTNQVGGAVQALTKLKVLLAGAKPYFAKIEEEMPQSESGKPLPAISKEISVENLSFSYTDQKVLCGLDLDFIIGGKYVLVGKSGCGKSTLLKLLLGQLKGYQGKILFDGQEASGYDENSFYQQMAYIEQNVFLFNTSIRENITMGDSFTEAEMKEALEKSALLKDIDRFPEGLDTVVGENGKLLSGGQKQRIAIARALIHNRSILIVDEGTSALDQENASLIEDALLQCKGLTVIMVSHHLREEKKAFYTDVYRLENGRRA